jgi:hypothetical protein
MREDSVVDPAFTNFVQHVRCIVTDDISGINGNGIHHRSSMICSEHFGTVSDAVLWDFAQDMNLCSRRNECGAYPIHIAAYRGNTEIVERMISIFPLCVSLESSEGALPIHVAAYCGNKEVCSLLFHQDPATLTTKTHHGFTAEDIARLRGYLQLAEILQFAVLHLECGDPVAVVGTVATGTHHTAQQERSEGAEPQQFVHIPTQAHLAEVSQDSLGNGMASQLDVSQLLLDEFHRASLLEEETDLHVPAQGLIRYEKFPRTVPTRASFRGGAAQASLMYNLSDELATAGHAGHNARGHTDLLLSQGLTGRTLPTLSPHAQSPFMFQQDNNKQPSRASTAKFTARPHTALETIARAAAAKADRRPSSATDPYRSNTGADTRQSGKLELHKTVQVTVEPSVPALIITSAVVQPSPRGKSNNQRRNRNPRDALSAEPPPGTAPKAMNGHDNSDYGSPPVYSLRKPPSRPCSPRASSLPAKARTHTSPQLSSPVVAHDVSAHHVFSAVGRAVPSPPGHGSPSTQTRKHPTAKANSKSTTPGNFRYVKYALEVRGLEATTSPPREPSARTPAEAPRSPVGDAPVEKTIISRPYIPKVTVDPALPRGSHADTRAATTEQCMSYRAFAPPRALRPTRTPAAAAAVPQSPALRQRLNLDRMAEEAARLAEDSQYVPSLRPVLSAGARTPQPQLAKEAQHYTASRADRLNMLVGKDAAPAASNS